MPERLPIDDVLPELLGALRASGRAVLQAPPGAGKTTRVPLALLQAGLAPGRIVMLEPRRIAARAAADRLARQLGETPGGTVGYRMRGDSRPGTGIEVVTEGILTRMIQSDPELAGIGAVIFDEFHERSLNADLGLALVLELRAALRPDLLVLVMSATLEAAPVAALMDDAPMVTTQGRAFPVDIRPLEAPLPKATRLDQATADTVLRALDEAAGSVLVFLPGEAEIRRTEARLSGRTGDAVLRPLYGALPLEAQRAAIAPGPGRKVVLATSIAETSLTIEGIGVVVDAGRARRARFDPGSGMTRLVTERVTRAEATQRAGRAGRLGPGVCYRLWTRGEDGALAAFPPAEIEVADLTPLALELALWGSDALPFLTPPPDPALAAARRLLQALGALDAGGGITAHGRALAALPLHPRLGHMLTRAGAAAAALAALMADRDPLKGAPADMTLRLKALAGRHDGPGEVIRPALERIRTEAKRLARLAGPGDALSPAQAAALAYPDRIAGRRPGEAPRYLLSGGKGAALDPADPLAGQRLLVVTDTDGARPEARIRVALPIPEAELRAVLGDRIGWHDHVTWSRRQARVEARRQERLGALVLEDRAWDDAPAAALRAAMRDGVRALGLSLSGKAALFRARVEAARAGGADLPDMSDAALMAGLADWLDPFLDGLRSAADWKRFDPLPALEAMLDWGQRQALDAAAPAGFTTPLGRKVAIDYGGEAPEIALRLQEMFGVTRHPVVAGRPLRITLLSPAGRPVQTTTDLPGFWAGSYADVRKDMRARYPRHPWPEDPTRADPTLRAKPRGP
ncbi:MAG: ATP-dependent helicase HrpB [Rhodobacteraceae bacterium HLUCCA08]|nr:MAG: ATP-dependent helicase HrpB [Rhodobacteraceae bacterium HLUCCA08]